ncbi:MAG: glycine--tRNA ligase subunit beta [Coriobacteriales bacterium]|nr:glycine--tRNA ligase subunit beta [Coriobacteriales bacterium]
MLADTKERAADDASVGNEEEQAVLQHDEASLHPQQDPEAPATLVFEIGTEELPSAPLYRATKQLAELAEAALKEARLEHGELTTRSTPRRIILEVRRLAPRSTPLVRRLRGPAAHIAYDGDGNPTKAAEGFARNNGVDVRALTRGKEGDTEYVYASVEQVARRAHALLPDLLAGLVTQVSWPKSQRWGSTEEVFCRPVRWLLALWGQSVIPVRFAGLVAGRATWGHRLIANKCVEVASADDLVSEHTKLWVVSSADMRAGHIRAQVKTIEDKTGLVAMVPDATFAEVVNLVEFPTTLMGSFDEEFLAVPPEIVADAMLKHQRYFPLRTQDGALSNHFLVVSNGSPAYNSSIIEGHERVIRPRLADAAFFVNEDRKVPLETFVERLGSVVFHEKLGSLREKADRIVALSELLAIDAGATPEQAAAAARAALLCKADLVTNAVVEFTTLQGVMGSHYALAQGETPAVADAIREHYRPRFAADDLPASFEGKTVALADKIDTVAGIFAVGQAPSGSSDPYALRRAAIGIINILLDGFGASLACMIDAALDGYRDQLGEGMRPTQATRDAVRAFFVGRLEVMARERGFAPDTVLAVIAAGCLEPVELMARCEALTEARALRPELFDDLAVAYARANNLRDGALGAVCDEALFNDDERALAGAIASAQTGVDDALCSGSYAAALACLSSLRAPIDAFFESTLIMAADERLRANRLRLLNRFVAVFADVADFGKLAG